MRPRAFTIAVGLLIGCLAAAPLLAETSSWSKQIDVPKPRPGAKVKLAPAPDMTTLTKGAATPAGKGPAGQSLVEPTGEEAAYIAFEQGQYLTAKKLAEAAAKGGDPQAHTLLGGLYAEGLGVPKKLDVAIKWYKRGDELGDVQAAFALGVLFAEGRGVEKDRNKAAELFEKAARTGHPLANYNLGLLFLKGEGKPQNPYRAAMHIRYAAEKGIAAAQFDMAGLYQNGTGVEPDAVAASHWLGKAAQQGMAEAQFEYAILLLKGFGLTRDEPKAVPYLRSAAQKGLVTAQNRLAHVYQQGITVKKSPMEAAKWRLVAKAGGVKDDELDALIEKMPKDQRLAAEKAAMEWREQAGLF